MNYKMEKIEDKQYGIGIDVTNINFFHNKSITFVKRILTTTEYSEFLKTDLSLQTKFLATRWALKEAAFKAVSEFHNILFTNIEFIKNNKGFYTCTTFNNLKCSVSYNNNQVFAIALYLK